MSETAESWAFELPHSASMRSRVIVIGAAIAALALGTSAVAVGVGALDRPRELPLPQLSAIDPILAPTAGPVFVVSHQGPPPTFPSAVVPEALAVRPVRIVVPRIGVDAPVVRLGLDQHGALEVPSSFDQAGWWEGGTLPGNVGPAIIVGHVDSTSGPAVFYRLRGLHAGDSVLVQGIDGRSVRFVVQRLAIYPKSAFPSRAVYSPIPYAGLRLITCGGPFDYRTGHYVDNVIVFARIA